MIAVYFVFLVPVLHIPFRRMEGIHANTFILLSHSNDIGITSGIISNTLMSWQLIYINDIKLHLKALLGTKIIWWIDIRTVVKIEL